MSTIVMTAKPTAPHSTANTRPATAPSPAPQEIVFQAGLGFIVSACLGVFVKLRIADLLGDKSMEVKRLAEASGAQEGTLFRVLRALEANGIVRRTAPRTFALTAAGAILRHDSQASLAPAMEWLTDSLHLSLYSQLQGSVETGATTFDEAYGEPFFDWLSKAENTEEAGVFNRAMTSISEMCIPAFLEAYDFSAFATLVDVGGGHGAILRAILKANPQMRGLVAEMDTVVPQTRQAIAADQLSDRCDAVACNFFQAVPAGGDAYFMKHIVHDWDDRQALTLLRNIRAVMPRDGRLVLAECVLDDSATPHPGKLLDIEMLAFVGGKERTAAEFRQLLLQAGFWLKKVVPTRSALSLLEAIPV